MKIIPSKTVTLISGLAKGGIGHAVANRLLEDESNAVIGVSRTIQEEDFPEIFCFQCDCTIERALTTLERNIRERFPEGIDLLVNCVGGSLGSRDFQDVDKDFFDRVVATNLTTAFLLSQFGARLVKPGGAIVHIVSSAAYEPETRKMPYAVSKAAVAHLIRCVAKELTPQNIRVNGVSPTYVFTQRHIDELRARSTEEKPYETLVQAKVQKQYLKEPLTPEDLADTILYAGTASIVGETIDVSLGRVL